MKSIFLLVLSFLIILCSCKNNAGQKQEASLTDSTSYTGLTGDAVKLIKTAGINFKVKDVEQSTRAISNLARKFGGMIYNQNLQSAEEGRKELKISTDSLMVITAFTPRAVIALRVPSTNLEEFMYSVADLGYYTGSSQLTIDDKSLLYLQNALKQKARVKVLSHPSSSHNNSSDSATIVIHDQAIDLQIANKSTDGDAAYSVVNLSLFQNAVVRKETIANYVLSDYDLPFGQRLSNAISTGWQYFLALALALVHLWIFILLGMAGFIGYKHWQRRKFIVVNVKQ